MNAPQAFDNAALVSYLPGMTPTAAMNASGNKCMMEVIQIVSAHTADVLVHIMKIISEKYNHPIPEMMEVVRTHPAFHAIQMHPILTTDFFNIPAVTPAPVQASSPVQPSSPAAAVVAAPVPVPILAPKKVTKIVRKKVEGNTSTQAAQTLTPTPTINTNIPSPTSPLSQVVVIESPPASTVIEVSAPSPVITPTSPIATKKPALIIKKKEPIIEADKKEVKPHTY